MSPFATLTRTVFFSLVFLCLNGCAGLYQDMDPPKVSVDSFRSLPAHDGAPRFEIKLRVINPNTEPLDIAGVSYTIELLNRELIAGVTNDVPIIEGYSEEVVTLEAGLQLFELLRFLAALGQTASNAGPLEYKFAAKIDFRGLIPTQRVEDTGQISLN